MQGKLPAYTILEVIITMLITAILVGITYTAYTIVSQSYLSFNSKHSELGTVLQLDKLLKKDFSRPGLIFKTSNGIDLKGDSLMVSYSFLPDQVLRTQGVTDTFKVKTTSMAMLFEGQPVEMTAPEPGTLLDELTLELIIGKEKIPYHYYKTYSSAELLQQRTNALN